MRLALAAAVMIAPGVAMADASYPALHDVVGVADNDVLNIRSDPGLAGAVIGSLPPDAKAVEVLWESEDGAWGMVNTGESAGWVRLQFLKAQDRPAWYALQGGLMCGGTEPFWSLYIAPGDGVATLATPDAQGPEMKIMSAWPGESWRKAAGLQIGTGTEGGFVALTGAECFDGMSDRRFSLRADLYLFGAAATPAPALQGCCTLVP